MEEERGDLPLTEEPVGGLEMVRSEPVEDGVLGDGTLFEVELRFA